jgi:3-mercaptopyruvate sulfurtransferase SseA
MIPVRSLLPALGVFLILASCAEPVKNAVPPASVLKDAGPLKPKYKKPVRMNGRGKISSVSFEDFFALHQSGKALIYDARPAFFYNISHIPGAINLPRGTTDEQIAARESEIRKALAEGKSIVTYCTGYTCPDARTLADHISGFGHPVSIFSGGWHAWAEAEMPVE